MAVRRTLLPFDEERDEERSDKKRRVQGGEATSDVVLSAHVGSNADIFPQILALHLPEGARVADVTYGNGVFWRNVDLGKYELLATDISSGVDCRALPYDDNSLDVVVLDPPYMEGFYRREAGHKAGGGTHSAFRRSYNNWDETHAHTKRHDTVNALY